MLAVICATPGIAAGSFTLPAVWITNRTATAGCSESVTTKTRKPFGSVFVAAFGNLKTFGVLAAGICASSFTPEGTTPVPFLFAGFSTLFSCSPRVGGVPSCLSIGYAGHRYAW